MPRIYKRTSTKNQWTDEQLESAKRDIEVDKLSIRAAAIKHVIPPSTLRDHVRGNSKKRYGGPCTVFTAGEEKKIESVPSNAGNGIPTIQRVCKCCFG